MRPVHFETPMKKHSVPVLAFWLTLIVFCLPFHASRAANPTPPAPVEIFDYATPPLLTGTIYESGSDGKKILFTFRRTATRSNDVVRVERQFLRPDGFLAAVEIVTYQSNQLATLEMKEFQAGLAGELKIIPDAKKPARQKLVIGFGRGPEPLKSDVQNLPSDAVVDDTLYPFMLAHWDALMRGDAVKFHFVSLEWERTFVFRLVKIAETTQDGRAAVRIKMEPANLLVARLVNPLYFTVEKDAPHRVLAYVGRTTPRVKKGKSWKYLDAETVFDWKDTQSP